MQTVTLFDIWKRRRRAVHINAELARAFARFQLDFVLVATPISLILAFFSSVKGSQNSLIFMSVLGIGSWILLLLWRKAVLDNYQSLMSRFSKSEAHPNIQVFEPEIAPDIPQYCREQAHRLGLDPDKLRFYHDEEDMTEGACTIESEQHINVLFAAGFFKLWLEHPNAGQALLAHELGHSAQRDTAAWTFVECYLRIFPRRFILLQLASLALSQAFIGLSGSGQPSNSNGSGVSLALYAFIPLLVFLVCYTALARAGRRESERLADIVALMLASPTGLEKALQIPRERISHHSEFHNFAAPKTWFSTHPSRKWRIAQIHRFQALPGGLPTTAEEIRLTPPDQKTPAALPRPFRLGYLSIGAAFTLGILAVICLMSDGTGSASDEVTPTGMVFRLFSAALSSLASLALTIGLGSLLYSLFRSNIRRIRQGMLLSFVGTSICIPIAAWGATTNNDLITAIGVIAAAGTLISGIISTLVGYYGREIE